MPAGRGGALRALGMGDHGAEAAFRERRAVVGEGLDRGRGRGFDEQPAAAGRSLRDHVEFGVGQLARVARVELAAGAHSHADGVLLEQRRERVDALGDRGDLERPVAIDVRGDGDVADAFGGESPGVCDRPRLRRVRRRPPRGAGGGADRDMTWWFLSVGGSSVPASLYVAMVVFPTVAARSALPSGFHGFVTDQRRAATDTADARAARRSLASSRPVVRALAAGGASRAAAAAGVRAAVFRRDPGLGLPRCAVRARAELRPEYELPDGDDRAAGVRRAGAGDRRLGAGARLRARARADPVQADGHRHGRHRPDS